jgi:hypothetical protein
MLADSKTADLVKTHMCSITHQRGVACIQISQYADITDTTWRAGGHNSQAADVRQRHTVARPVRNRRNLLLCLAAALLQLCSSWQLHMACMGRIVHLKCRALAHNTPLDATCVFR